LHADPKFAEITNNIAAFQTSSTSSAELRPGGATTGLCKGLVGLIDHVHRFTLPQIYHENKAHSPYSRLQHRQISHTPEKILDVRPMHLYLSVQYSQLLY
jgi:hypothetical protein